jgi:hypothetical protein
VIASRHDGGPGAGSRFDPVRDQGFGKGNCQQVTSDLVRQGREVELGGAVKEPHGFNPIPSPLDLERLAEQTLKPVGVTSDPKARADHVSYRESLAREELDLGLDRLSGR